MGIFDSVQVKKPRRSKKNMTYLNVMTTRFGVLTPTMCKEVYPNETWRMTPTVLCRMTPLIAPLMSKMEIRVDYFFVPNRILWTDWEEFITRGIDGMSELELPKYELRGLRPYNGSLADYLNLPTTPYGDVTEIAKHKWDEQVQILPFAAYQKIYADWYLDENLQDADLAHLEFPMTTEQLEDPDNIGYLSTIRSRGWKKDYFTACLPWAQRGPEVSMRTQIVGNGQSIGQIKSDAIVDNGTDFQLRQRVQDPSGESRVIDSETEIDGTDVWPLGSQSQRLLFEDGLRVYDKRVDSLNGVLDGLEGEGFTINEFRRLYRLQLWFERNARAGGRYIESILAHFGKRVPDYRLDRSEYIGGVVNDFNFGEVLQTSSNDDSTGQALGAYAGRGISLLNGKVKKYRVDEHGYIMGILSIRPKRNAYYQGVPRQFSRKTALDFMWPLFTSLGEQEVKNKEIYLDDDEDVRDAVFGYNPRYSELYQSMDEIHGEMRNTLDFWHTARKFAEQPTLSRNLVQLMNAGDELNRVFAFNDTALPYDSKNDHFILEVRQDIRAKRCLPVYPVPSL